MEQRRVLWLIKGLGPGGAEHLLVEHARAGDHEAFDYEVAYAVPSKAHLVGRLQAAGVQVHALRTDGDSAARWVWQLRRLIVDRRPDVIHTHSPALSVVVRLLARSVHPRPALVYTEHNRWPRHRALTRAINRLTYGLDDVHIAVSEDVKMTISMRARRDVEVIRHGVDIARIQAAQAERGKVRAELDVDVHEVVIACVANYRTEKNYPLLLRAAAMALAQEPLLRFVAVGQGPLAGDVAALHRELGLGRRFALLGYRDDVPRILAAADVFTLTSDHEGFPVAVMEALAAGLPIVATDVGGLREAVTTGREGVLVPPRATRALAAAYVRIASDKDFRDTLARAAALRGSQLRSEAPVRRLEEIYRQNSASARG